MITDFGRGEELTLLLGLLLGLSVIVYGVLDWRKQITEREERIRILRARHNDIPHSEPNIHSGKLSEEIPSLESALVRATKNKIIEIYNSAETKLKKSTQRIGISLAKIFAKLNDISYGEPNTHSSILSKEIPSLKGARAPTNETSKKTISPIITPQIHATKRKRPETYKSAETKLTKKRTPKIGISPENMFDKQNNIFHGETNILSGIFSKGIPSIEGNLQSIFLISLVIILSGTSYVYFTRYQTSTQSFLVYEQNYLNFQNQYFYLEENYLELLNTTSTLEQYYSDTRVMYDTLRDEYSDLQKIQANIISENAKFQQEYSLALAEKNEIQTELDEIISFSKNETLVANASYELGSGGNLTLIYDLQYAGYIEITFNATTDIYMWIGSSITEGTYYSRYPTFPGTSYNGHFIVPTSKTLYVFLANTDIESTSEIVISIEYVY